MEQLSNQEENTQLRQAFDQAEKNVVGDFMRQLEKRLSKTAREAFDLKESKPVNSRDHDIYDFN